MTWYPKLAIYQIGYSMLIIVIYKNQATQSVVHWPKLLHEGPTSARSCIPQTFHSSTPFSSPGHWNNQLTWYSGSILETLFGWKEWLAGLFHGNFKWDKFYIDAVKGLLCISIFTVLQLPDHGVQRLLLVLEGSHVGFQVGHKAGQGFVHI